MKSDPKRVEHATSLYGVLTDFLGAENLPNYPEFVGIYGRVRFYINGQCYFFKFTDQIFFIINN